MVKNSSLELGRNQQNALTDWFRSPLGQWLTGQEYSFLEQPVSRLFGYYLLQIGSPDPSLRLLDPSPAKSKLVVDLVQPEAGGVVTLRADPRQLPLASDSVDGVIMHHALDFTDDPHQVLREVERILIPEGRLIIVGFNPWSLWGLWRLLHLRRRPPPWNGHFFSVWRMADWLSLLGFAQDRAQFLAFGPPLQNPVARQRLAFLGRLGTRMLRRGGAVYVIHARKRTATMTLIWPKWRIRKKVLPGAVEPTARNRLQ